MKKYGEYLREIRIEKGKTLKDIERETGINNSNLSRWENNKAVPSIYYCEQLADYYGITVDYLIGRDTHK